MKKVIAATLALFLAMQSFSIFTPSLTVSADNELPPAVFGPTPSVEQFKYHQEELSGFIHYGLNTFYNAEWTTEKKADIGTRFDPKNGIDAEQWVRMFKDMGCKRIIVTAKHHDGFCIWDSPSTTYDIKDAATVWQANTAAQHGFGGDILKEISYWCTELDMDMGLYLSPWDAVEPSYGNGSVEDANGLDDYNRHYIAQLREIMNMDKYTYTNPTTGVSEERFKYGNNGKFVEAWMDGANGGRIKQHYQFQKIWDEVHAMQPDTKPLFFGPYASEIRWSGSESGFTGDPTWSKIIKERLRTAYDSGREEAGYLQTGDPDGNIWSIGEADVSLPGGWFYHGNAPKSMQNLQKIFFETIGRGSPLLLNIPPNKEGKMDQRYLDRMKEFSQATGLGVQDPNQQRGLLKNSVLDRIAATATATAVRGTTGNYAASKAIDGNYDTYWTMNDGVENGSITIDLGTPTLMDTISIQEYIKLGQRISSVTAEVEVGGTWRPYGGGNSVGYRRLIHGAPVMASKVKITVQTYKTPEALPQFVTVRSNAAPALISEIDIFKGPTVFEIEESDTGSETLRTDLSFINATRENNPNLAWDGNWIHEGIGLLGSSKYSTALGASATFTFTGTKAWLVCNIDPGHGPAKITIDGVVVTPNVSTRGTPRKLSQIVYQTPDLTQGPHTIKVEVATAGQAVAVDGLYYLNNGGAGAFEIESKKYSVIEQQSLEVKIKRIGGSTGSASVTVTTPPGTAVQGQYYEDVNQVLTFAAGETEKIVTINTKHETTRPAPINNFYVEIDTPTGGSKLGFLSKAKVDIMDTDFNTPEIVVPPVPGTGTYTATNRFIFPTESITKVLEAELFELNSTGAVPGKEVRIDAIPECSGGKCVGWMENGNKMKLFYNAPAAGIYGVTLKYRSGRSETSPNAVNISGTGIDTVSFTVANTGGGYATKSFELNVKAAGDNFLEIIADERCGPNIDKFDITLKDFAPMIEPFEVNPLAFDITTAKNLSIAPTIGVRFAVAADVLSYAWAKDGATIQGSTANTFTKNAATYADSGKYTVTATNTRAGITGKKTATRDFDVILYKSKDVNMDSNVDIADALEALKYGTSAKTEALSTAQRYALNKQAGSINVDDVKSILDFVIQ